MIESKFLNKQIPTQVSAVFLFVVLLVTASGIFLTTNPPTVPAEVKGVSTVNIDEEQVLSSPVSSPVPPNIPVVTEVPIIPLPETVAAAESTSVAPAPIPQPTPAPAPTPPPVQQNCELEFNGQLLTLINNYRIANAKTTLSLNSNLNSAACGHSTWMSSTGTFSHTGSNGSSSGDRCNAAGGSCDAENLAWNDAPTAQRVFDQWKASTSGHNTTMLGDHTIVGIGLSGIYVTADFQ